MQCAIRETYEEIGLTLDGLLKEEDYIEVQHGGFEFCVPALVRDKQQFLHPGF